MPSPVVIPSRRDVPIFQVRATPMSESQVVDLVLSVPAPAVRIANFNLHAVHLYHRNADFRRFTDAADVVLADGFPIWRALHSADPSLDSSYRVGSSDWLFALLDCDPDLHIVAVGASPESAARAAEEATRRAPRVRWSAYDGYAGAQHSGVPQPVEQAIADADVVLVGMGMGKQEKWIEAHQHLMTRGVIANVGGCLDYLSGVQAHTPREVGRGGWEWAYRFSKDPRRNASRVLLEPAQLGAVLARRNLSKALWAKGKPRLTQGASLASSPTDPVVAAVVVTYNRRDLLLESLAAITAQEPSPEHLVVVDNASTDGSAEAVAEHFPGVVLIRCEVNTGGAGGFAVGMQRAFDLGADAIWLMDDDTIPEPGALRALLTARADYARLPSRPEVPALLASRVEWIDGREHPMNTARTKVGADAGEHSDARAVGGRPIRTASFVSILVDAAAARRVGLPIADFFIWNDDFEYCARLTREGRGLHIPASVVRHKTKVFGGTDADPGARFYYEVRNKLWTYSRSAALTPAERVLYAGASLRHWARTIARSHDRQTLLDGVRRGVRDGLKAPRENATVISSAKPRDY